MATPVRSVFSPLVLLGLSIGLAGCGSSTIHTTSNLGDVNLLSVDAKQRVIIQGKRNGKTVICAEPSPDALVARAAVLSASGSFSGANGGSNGSASGGFGSQESAATISHRTQSIQVFRDGYFRLCEAYLNGAIGPEQYEAVVTNLDTFINIAIAIDGMGNAAAAPGVGIGTGNISFNGNSATAGQKAADPNAPVPAPDDTSAANSGGIGTAPAPTFQTNFGNQNVTEKTAAATAQIVRDYLNYKEDTLCIQYGRCQRRLNNATLPNAAWQQTAPTKLAPANQ